MNEFSKKTTILSLSLDDTPAGLLRKVQLVGMVV